MCVSFSAYIFTYVYIVPSASFWLLWGAFGLPCRVLVFYWVPFGLLWGTLILLKGAWAAMGIVLGF